MAFDLKTILDKVLELGNTVIPVLSGTPAGPVLTIGRELLELVNRITEVIEEDDAERLKALREELEPLVAAHADATVDRLRTIPGDPGAG